ncbi:hypothetical protein [Paenibacillus cisolokensis]|nr:hypothetical protein [Paenibacillus cisolokensis]
MLRMKQQTIRLAAAIVILGTGLWIGTKWPSSADVGGGAAVPGSVDDPVVTKSYVDQRLAALGGQSGGGTGGGGTTEPSNGQGAAFQVVVVKKGKTLIAHEGAQAVVRSGKAVAYSPDKNGIADVTDGVDLTNGKAVPENHLILFPRGGRGVTTAPGFNGNLTVIISGGYDLKTLP